MENLEMIDKPKFNKERIQEYKKEIAIMNLCNQIETFYIYARRLIPKDKEHNLGFRKEMIKGQIETIIKGLK